MGAPHNKNRYGEVWDQHRTSTLLAEAEAVKGVVVFSGGLAWHFMSPPHDECLKHAHDMKDMDVMVHPTDVAGAISRFESRGFQRVWTRYDRLPSEEDFRRYEKVAEVDGRKPVKIVVDFFVKDVPSIEVNGYRVVEPRTLLSYYGSIHSSDKCFAVQAATRLIARGINPVGHPSLVAIPKESSR